MTTYPDLKNEPELLKIKTNDYELKNIKEKMTEIEHQKKFDNQYNQFAIILDELKKDKLIYKKKASKKNNRYSINLLVYCQVFQH